MTFEPVGRAAGEILELRKELRFPPAPNAPWTNNSRGVAVKYSGFIAVDTDGEGGPDTFLPGTSNFVAGLSHTLEKVTAAACHAAGEGQHCPTVVVVEQ